MARGELELRLLRIDLDELSLVRDRQGQWNFQEISRRIKEHTPPDERFTLDFAGIDILNLSVGRVKRVDLAAPDNVQVFRADLRDELFTDLRAPGDYVLAASRLALKLGLKRLTAGTTNVPPIRASPLTGDNGLPFDRFQRRCGYSLAARSRQIRRASLRR